MELSFRSVFGVPLVVIVGASTSRAQCMDWSALSTGTNGLVTCFAVYDSGHGPELYVGGEFTSAGGVPVNNIARWNGSSWAAVGRGLQGGSNQEFFVADAMLVHDDGTGPQLYVTGDFTYAGGQVVNNIARWDGAHWSALGSGLTGGSRPLGHALHAFDSGSGLKLYVGGEFTMAGGVVADSIAAWDGVQWSDVGGVFGSFIEVFALEDFDDGAGPQLYVGGSFYQFGPLIAGGMARWDGSTWTSMPGWPTTGETAMSLLVHDDGSGSALFVGGYLESYFGGVHCHGIARWDGASWSDLNQGTGPVTHLGDGLVFALQTFNDGLSNALYAAGRFHIPNTGVESSVARWDGTSWTPLDGVVFGAWVDALAEYTAPSGGTSKLIVGGAFDSLGTASARNVAAWESCRVSTFCFGSGPETYVNCSCGDSSLPNVGCPWSSGFGAGLATSGTIQPIDALVLEANQLPANTTVMFMKGDLFGFENLGDGISCVSGNRLLFGTRSATGGTASYPASPADAPLSVVGGTPVGSGQVAYYQAIYRNSAPFCYYTNYNLTSAVKVVW